MKPFRYALGLLVLGFAASASAVTSTYNFASATAGSSTWNATSAGGNATNGTNYGNYLSYMNTGGPADAVKITAWSDSGGTLNTAFLNNAYSCCSPPPVQTELAITSRSTVNGSGTSASSDQELTGWAVNTSSGEHAIDNKGANEALLMSFTKAVTLTSLSVGYIGGDSDATVLEYTGSGDPTTAILGKTFTQLLGLGWKIVANPTLAYDATTGVTGGTASKYWMVGAYIANISGAGGTNGAGDANWDSFKLTGFAATQAVPEPGSLALFGIAGAALLVGRRRRAARNV